MPKTVQQKKKTIQVDDQPSLLNEEFDLEIDFSTPTFLSEEPPKRSTRSQKGSTKYAPKKSTKKKGSTKRSTKIENTKGKSKKGKKKESLSASTEAYRSIGKDSLSLFDQMESDLMSESDFFPDPVPSFDISAQSDLLVDMWEDDQYESEREKQRMKDFYEQSIENTHKRFNRQDDDSVVRKIQVGLYESDAALLEELFQQSKRAGLPNVSRARILRVALRHFHTCWLNQDPS